MPGTVGNETYQSLTFDAIRIGLASPEKIRQWSHGEVKKPETINYRTLKPEKDGLYCEKIFGPSKDWECHCGKYKKIRYKGVVCDKCGVEVTKSSVRRERMGHIELAAPVSHIWYFKGIPSRMGLILDMTPKNLEKVLYFAAYIVLDAGQTTYSVKDILGEREYQKACQDFPDDPDFRVGMGAEAILELLKDIDLDKTVEELSEELVESTGQKRAKIIKRLEAAEAFRSSGNRPEWMILTVIPVIPPEIRPMVQLDGGRFATSDLNDLYRRIINRNNRLKRLLELGAPDIIVRNEKRMLQEAVDALIDNGRRGRPVTGPGNRAMKSLSDMLKGKQGRFRQNLLGKRVDYSGRSVIVVGPELKIYQCGLPKEMAIELFKPFVMKELVSRGKAHNIKSAKRMVERLQNEVWDVLEDVIREHPVMLNRAPTLHRLGIQAFEPILVEGKAIKLHPLACTAFNADFDGDQMAVHVPLFVEAQGECRFILLSPNNLLKPSDGAPVTVPTQDMVLGIYYLTLEKPGDMGDRKPGEERYFKNVNEALLSYANHYITLQEPIKVRITGPVNGVVMSKVVKSTLGRFLFNEGLPQDLGFVDRSDPANDLVPEVNFLVKKGELKKIINKCISIHGATRTAEVLDYIKATGYKYSTISGISVSISDMTVPPEKEALVAQAENKVEEISTAYRRGLLSNDGRYKAVIDVWNGCQKEVSAALKSHMDEYNNIHMMADSGARGSDKQIEQLAGMRGLMSDTQGRAIELPIKSNFREGLDVLEYFISAHGARKGLSDTALRTADSGYMTRRLVDVSQDLIIRENDCAENLKKIPGMWIEALTVTEDKNEVILEKLADRISGRYSADDVVNPETDEIIVKADHMITPKRAAMIEEAGIKRVRVRTALSCMSHVGICAKCYGQNMATGMPVQIGESVGIIAAQSIGEPGTQLTMRTFHTGGVATGTDITQGLPRVEELFEARKPKGLAIISEFGGEVAVRESKKKREVIVTAEDGSSKVYSIPFRSELLVENGQAIEAGDSITKGSINPHDILRIRGVRAAQDYIIREVQKVYRNQGVEINDKHIEVIVRQMMKKIHIDKSGDTNFLPGTLVDILDFDEANEELVDQGKEPAVGTHMMLGITKASLATNSWLSAASFQETTKVLTDAAIKGKVDPLIGLKENVILGKLIPAGTGMKRYRSTRINTEVENPVIGPDDEIRLSDDEFLNEDFSDEAEDSGSELDEDFSGESDASDADEFSDEADIAEEDGPAEEGALPEEGEPAEEGQFSEEEDNSDRDE